MNPSDSNGKPLALPPAGTPSLADSTLVHSNFLVRGLTQPHETGPQLPPAMSGTPTLPGLLQALRRRLPLALGLAAVGSVLAVVAVFFLMPPKYPTQIRLLVASRPDAKLFDDRNDEPDFPTYKLNMAAMIKGPAILSAALNQKTSTGTEVKDLALIKDNGLEWLETALKSDYLLGPEILRVTLSTERPDEGFEVLNAIARAFIEELYLKEAERREKRVKDYKDNLTKLEGELSELRRVVRLREKMHKVADPSVVQMQHQAAIQQQVAAGKAFSDNRTEQIKKTEELASLQDRLKKLDQLAITQEKLDEAFRKDDRAQGIVLELKKVEKDIVETARAGQPFFVREQLERLDEKKKAILRSMTALKTEMRPDLEKAWRNKVGDELQDRLVELQAKLSALKNEEPVLKAEFDKMGDAVKLLAPGAQVPLEILALQNKITNLETSVSDVARTIQKMVAEVVNPRVSLLQAATLPKNKDYSRQSKLAGAGGFGMFFVVLFGVAMLEFRSRKISGADELSHGLGLNIVGSLPPMPPQARKATGTAVTPAKTLWESQLTEAIDGIRTMLMHASRAENLRVIMITSACSGEGKTSLATQLAASLARAWRKTLLIDADLRKPAAHKVFGLAQEPGFSELLRNEIAVNDAVKPTALSRLWLMPAGHFDTHAVQALAQDNVRTLFEQLKQQYDFIIVDSCPVLPVADSLLLGQHVDGVIFSVLRDVSRVPAVYAAQQKVANLAIRSLGAVMIGAKSETGNPGYALVGSK